MRLRHQIPLLLTLLFPAAALAQTAPAFIPPTPAEIRAVPGSWLAATDHIGGTRPAEQKTVVSPRNLEYLMGWRLVFELYR